MSTRIKNPWFWVGILAAVLSAIGLSPEMFTSWDVVWTEFVSLLSNPFRLGLAAVTILGIFVDPSTPGLTDGSK